MKVTVKITFVEEVLGTLPGSKDVYRDFIGRKSPDATTIEEEVAAVGVEGVLESKKTVFPKLEDGTPFLYDYQIKGFFKNACSALQRVAVKDENGKKTAPNESAKIKAFKKEIDGIIFPQPRKIPLVFDGEIGECSRPLRAQTARGERVALALSESAPEGTTATFDILLLSDDLLPAVLEWLDYGALNGLGQWHNGGKGRFTYEVIP